MNYCYQPKTCDNDRCPSCDCFNNKPAGKMPLQRLQQRVVFPHVGSKGQKNLTYLVNNLVVKVGDIEIPYASQSLEEINKCFSIHV